METNTGNGNKRKRNSNSATGTDKKNMKKILKMTPQEFHYVDKTHLELKIFKLLAENEERERKIKMLSRRIMELEQAVIVNNYNDYVAKHKQLEKELNEKRGKIAERLNVESLDKYFVDDETYELKHEDDII